jgi:formate dehydrogenase assembly factor FdhD
MFTKSIEEAHGFTVSRHLHMVQHATWNIGQMCCLNVSLTYMQMSPAQEKSAATATDTRIELKDLHTCPGSLPRMSQLFVRTRIWHEAQLPCLNRPQAATANMQDPKAIRIIDFGHKFNLESIDIAISNLPTTELPCIA